MEHGYHIADVGRILIFQMQDTKLSLLSAILPYALIPSHLTSYAGLGQDHSGWEISKNHPAATRSNVDNWAGSVLPICCKASYSSRAVGAKVLT